MLILTKKKELKDFSKQTLYGDKSLIYKNRILFFYINI